MMEDHWTKCNGCEVSVFPPGREEETGFSDGSICSAESNVLMEPYLSDTCTLRIEPTADQVNTAQFYKLLLQVEILPDLCLADVCTNSVSLLKSNIQLLNYLVKSVSCMDAIKL